MNKYFYILLLLSFGTFGQTESKSNLTEKINQGWTSLNENWKYQKGDDIQWAQPSYNDNFWKTAVTKGNLNQSNDKQLAGENEIVWFRRKIKVDSTFKESIIFNVMQSGASDIYLDGKLLRSFGMVSNNPKIFQQKSADDDIFILPLEPGKEQILAVRYATGSQNFPIYNKLWNFRIQITTMAVLNSPDRFINNKLALLPVGFDMFLISLGATSLISILFFTLFLFFPKERINGFFALSTFCMSWFIILRNQSYAAENDTFWLSIFSGIFLLTGILIMLFCVYRILKHKIGFWFWTLCGLCFLSIISRIVYPISYFGIVLILHQLTVIIVSFRSLKTNRIAALIFISCMGITFIYFISNMIFNALDIDTSAYSSIFSGLSFMLLPLSIAIYLGYSFSQRSKSLATQLKEVKKLSAENTRILSEQKDNLEKEVALRTQDLNTSLENLKATQSQLIQSEKMASLGELTAGIAHEIQNPLNFVNNFSEVNTELLEDMNGELDKGNLVEVKQIAKDILENEQKINHHGKRADAIVKGMLQHSRSSSGTKEPTDINKLADEYLRLAYHGLRAKDKSFNATMKTDYDETIGTIKIIPQDIGRVILNLITNAFYATNEKQKSGIDNYEPTITVSTKKVGAIVEVSVKDNGNGIPQTALDKIFQPFFTTKPAGQGTGLGLSLSYDIVKAHGGELKVETEENQGTTFKIVLHL
ncbi:MAG: two-component system NtrC family sensor kinase [Flavobacteriales bacterium]|jgi:two-component system NtrC family sensor kinase